MECTVVLSRRRSPPVAVAAAVAIAAAGLPHRRALVRLVLLRARLLRASLLASHAALFGFAPGGAALAAEQKRSRVDDGRSRSRLPRWIQRRTDPFERIAHRDPEPHVVLRRVARISDARRSPRMCHRSFERVPRRGPQIPRASARRPPRRARAAAACAPGSPTERPLRDAESGAVRGTRRRDGGRRRGRAAHFGQSARDERERVLRLAHKRRERERDLRAAENDGYTRRRRGRRARARAQSSPSWRTSGSRRRSRQQRHRHPALAPDALVCPAWARLCRRAAASRAQIAAAPAPAGARERYSRGEAKERASARGLKSTPDGALPALVEAVPQHRDRVDIIAHAAAHASG